MDSIARHSGSDSGSDVGSYNGSYSGFSDHSSLKHFNQLATPIWVFDVDRHQVWWANPAALEFWEAKTLAELQQRDFSSDSDMVRMRLRQIVGQANGNERLQDTWTLYPNDAPKTVILSFLPVLIEKGVSAVLIEVKQFIDKSADEEAIRILEAAKASALMVSTFSLEGRLLAQNPAALSCYGRPSLAMNDNDMAGRLKDPAMAERLLEIARTGKSCDTEQVVWTQNGARVHRIRARRGRDPVTGAFVTVVSEEDVTEQASLRLRMQELNTELEARVAERTSRLRDSEERYALATQSAAIWDWDVQRDHLYVSPSFIKSLGYEAGPFREPLSSARIADFIHPDDLSSCLAELERHLQEPCQAFEHDLRLKTGSGGYRWYQGSGRCLCDRDGTPVRSVGLLTDISDRKELEASLFAAHRLEAIGQLTGGIAHDFNNLLTVMQGNAELLKVVDDPKHELAEAIKVAAQKGAELTRHLLAFSRKQTLVPKPVDLARLVSQMGRTLPRLLGEEISVKISIAADLWPAYADASQVENAILNLALNARDAMPSGGQLHILCRNRPIAAVEPGDSKAAALQPGDYVEFVMSDSGQGMPQVDLDRAFEPFFTTKEVGKGSGLGLSMVYGFSRQSGGDTQLQSEPGQGTQVSVFLPRSNQLPPGLVCAPQAVVRPGQGESIHLLEDDSAVQSTLRGILESLKYRVSLSSDAATALQVMSVGPPPDLILADVVLPGGESGLEFAKRISTIFPKTKVVLMSGYPQDQLSDASAEVGHVFLQKPMEKAQLSETLHTVLNSR